MRRDQASFTDVYEDPPHPGQAGRAGQRPAGADGGPDVDGTSAAGMVPDPEAVRQAREELAAAEAIAEAAAEARAAAEDDLADAEGTVAVAEFKSDDTERDQNLQGWQKAAAREELARARRRHARAADKFGQAEERLSRAQSDVGRAAAQLRTAMQTPATEEEPPAPRFASLPLFVNQYLLPNWVHRLGKDYGGNWCARWWEHPEAITRLEALWEAFEVMRLEPPPSLSTWLRDHLDVHMRALTLPYGVFHSCTVERYKTSHQTEPPWAADPAPDDMFTVNPNAMIQDHGRRETTSEGDDRQNQNDRNDSNSTGDVTRADLIAMAVGGEEGSGGE